MQGLCISMYTMCEHNILHIMFDKLQTFLEQMLQFMSCWLFWHNNMSKMRNELLNMHILNQLYKMCHHLLRRKWPMCDKLFYWIV